MKNYRIYIIGLLLVCVGFGCGKSSPTPSTPTITWDGNIVAYSPAAVSKSSSVKVFAHLLPWFNYNISSGVYFWGQHWTMVNENPNIITNNVRQIASYYYPSTGPYASNDTSIIDYQLLLMKLSGIDGIFIDWPGTLNSSDFEQNVNNTNVIISRLARAGLKYAIVYEDRNLPSSHDVSQAEVDLNYLQQNYFPNTTYEEFNGQPMLLDFGPVQLTQPSDWTTIFSTLSNKPALFTIMGQSGQAGVNAAGEFAWVEQNSLSGGLANFYAKTYSGARITTAFPGFKSFYAAGGWPSTGLTWVIDPSVATFQQTLTLALQQTSSNYMQLVTWNDYGEGTMIEPTTQFGYGFLTSLQQQLGVQSSLSQSDLELVAKLYNARVANIAGFNQTNLAELNQVYYDIASLRMDSAKALLAGF